jgi:hypothetical protein
VAKEVLVLRSLAPSVPPHIPGIVRTGATGPTGGVPDTSSTTGEGSAFSSAPTSGSVRSRFGNERCANRAGLELVQGQKDERNSPDAAAANSIVGPGRNEEEEEQEDEGSGWRTLDGKPVPSSPAFRESFPYMTRTAEGELVLAEPWNLLGYNWLTPPKWFNAIGFISFCWLYKVGIEGPLYDALRCLLADLLPVRGDHRLGFLAEVRRLGFSLALASQATYNSFWYGTAVPRKASAYSELNRARGCCTVGYRHQIAIQNWLVDNGYLHKVAGVWGKGAVGRRTILVPRPKFIAFAAEHLVGSRPYSMATFGQVYLRAHKDAGGRMLPIHKDRTILAMEADLQAINRVNRGCVVQDKCGRVLWNDYLALDRIFSHASFDLGGRCYGRFQNLTKADRASLTIDGEATVELDFNSLHIGMLFNQIGLACPHDPYLDVQVPGFESDVVRRKVVKNAINIAINAADRSAALRAINDKFAGKSYKVIRNWWTGKTKKKRRTGGPQPRILPPNIKAGDIVDAFKATHPKLEPFLHSNKGLELQRIDGDIAVQVMLRLTSLGKPCLGVHDSFIVKASDGDLLETAMKEEYFKKLGFEPGIT